MNPHLQQLAYLIRVAESHLRDHPRIAGGIAAGLVGSAGLAWYLIHSRRPTAYEIERRRRAYLTSIGRTTDGVVLDTRTLAGEDSTSPSPDVVVYSYRIAGVTYNCAQDVSALPERVAGIRLDQSIQIRYDPRNPGNSILVSEDWTGLWQRDG